MCRRLTYLCCADDDDDDDDDDFDDDDDDHYYDGEVNEEAEFDDDNDDTDVLKKVFFSDGHGVFTWLVSEHSCLAFINKKTAMTWAQLKRCISHVSIYTKKINLNRDRQPWQRIVIINEIKPTREMLGSKSK